MISAPPQPIKTPFPPLQSWIEFQREICMLLGSRMPNKQSHFQ